MKRKSLIITAIVALAVIGIVAVYLFMKDSKVEPANPKKGGKHNDNIPDAVILEEESLITEDNG